MGDDGGERDRVAARYLGCSGLKSGELVAHQLYGGLKGDRHTFFLPSSESRDSLH